MRPGDIVARGEQREGRRGRRETRRIDRDGAERERTKRGKKKGKEVGRGRERKQLRQKSRGCPSKGGDNVGGKKGGSVSSAVKKGEGVG